MDSAGELPPSRTDGFTSMVESLSSAIFLKALSRDYDAARLSVWLLK